LQFNSAKEKDNHEILATIYITDLLDAVGPSVGRLSRRK
jgi:hypothetical protein